MAGDMIRLVRLLAEASGYRFVHCSRKGCQYSFYRASKSRRTLCGGHSRKEGRRR